MGGSVRLAAVGCVILGRTQGFLPIPPRVRDLDTPRIHPLIANRKLLKWGASRKRHRALVPEAFESGLGRWPEAALAGMPRARGWRMRVPKSCRSSKTRAAEGVMPATRHLHR